MKTNSRKSECISCGGKLLGDLVHIGEQYPSAICSGENTDYRSIIGKSSLNLTKCANEKCGLVQLAYEYNLEEVLKNYPYLSGGASTMKGILSDVVKETEEIVSLNGDDVVLDIGGNDATLLSLLSTRVKQRVNIDPAVGITSVIGDSDYMRIEEKFSSKVYLDKNLPLPKLIFSIAMFYQIDKPFEFCEQVKEIMTDDTLWCIQMTYLGSMLEFNIYDNIVHEHVAYYSLKSLQHILNEAGLSICNMKIVKSYGGSLRVYVMKDARLFPKTEIRNEYQDVIDLESEKNINSRVALDEFNKKICHLKKMTRELIAQIVEKNGKIMALGASTKGNMICQFLEIGTEYIECVLDNNENKIGLIMAGSDIPVVDEKKYLSNLPDYLFVLPYYYIEFFKKLMKKFMKPHQKISIIVPLPEPHLIEIIQD